MNIDVQLKDFSGKAPIFPLPNVVQFPQTMLPLHIFEKRYRAMLKDALLGEKMIAMGVLKPGWEEKYSGNPDIYSTVCLGTIVQHETLADGRSNIILYGLRRARVKNIVSPRPYRMAEVELLEEDLTGLSEKDGVILNQTLLELYGEFVVEYAGGSNFPTLSDANLPLGALIDAIGSVVGLPTDELVYMLEETRVAARGEFIQRKLHEKLRRGHASRRDPAPHQMISNFGRIHLN